MDSVLWQTVKRMSSTSVSGPLVLILQGTLESHGEASGAGVAFKIWMLMSYSRESLEVGPRISTS